PMELLARERRTISVPFDGVIGSLGPGIEPGHKVEKGQPLVELDTSEMKLSELQSRAELAGALAEADEQRTKGDRAAAAQAEARADQAKAKADLLAHQIERSRILAPISGTIISGDLTDKVGASIKLGDKLFEVADLSDMIVVAKVDDRDIKLIEMNG